MIILKIQNPLTAKGAKDLRKGRKGLRKPFSFADFAGY
jgi:hypothetical protein